MDTVNDEPGRSRRRVLITGGTRGIGRAVADTLASGHHLVIGGRTQESVTEAIRRYPSAEPFVTDLTDGAATEVAVRQIGPIDALVHCAGAAWMGPADSFTRDQWREAFDINVIAAVDVTRLLLPQLRRQQGDVVFLNSGSGLYTYPGGSMYCATKFALKAYADSLREEERDRGVRVTSIHPGRVDTDMQRELQAGSPGRYQGQRYVRPESVAAAVRLALETTPEAALESVVIRPRTSP